MADDAFDVAVVSLLLEEGGYTEGLPDDPGGETNFGITKRSYPHLDIKALTREQAIEIYHRDFWDAPGLGLLPPKVGIMALDAAANEGQEEAVILLQRALGVNADGALGPITAHAAWTMDSTKLLISYATQRELHYSSLLNWKTYKINWTKRLLKVYTRCLLYGTPVALDV